jgi:hypothetical protein
VGLRCAACNYILDDYLGEDKLVNARNVIVHDQIHRTLYSLQRYPGRLVYTIVSASPLKSILWPILRNAENATE